MGGEHLQCVQEIAAHQETLSAALDYVLGLEVVCFSARVEMRTSRVAPGVRECLERGYRAQVEGPESDANNSSGLAAPMNSTSRVDVGDGRGLYEYVLCRVAMLSSIESCGPDDDVIEEQWLTNSQAG